MLTLAQNHLHPEKIKIIERSIGSSQHVFTKAHQFLNNIEPHQAKILENWFLLLTKHLPIHTDLIIYLRIDPKTAMTRLKQRNRYEERNIEITYIQLLNDLYDAWLYKNPGTKVITINANRTIEQIMDEINQKIPAQKVFYSKQPYKKLSIDKINKTKKTGKIFCIHVLICKKRTSKKNGVQIRSALPPFAPRRQQQRRKQ